MELLDTASGIKPENHSIERTYKTFFNSASVISVLVHQNMQQWVKYKPIIKWHVHKRILWSRIFNLLWHTSRFSKFRCFAINKVKQSFVSNMLLHIPKNNQFLLKIYFKWIFSALEELKKISKKTILDLYRHYFMDYIMFGLNSSTIDLLLDDNNLRLPHADLFKRKNSYWANSANREKYQAIRYC